tara:strand:- start:87 stop:263 length:177 start_codon:yes stop_codon:yes gene_type:complete
MESDVKKGQQINNEIPMEIWDDFEDLYVIEKRKDPSRKLNKKDFFVNVFKKGVESWVK